MPEDIPTRAILLTEDEKLIRASDWSDYRRDYMGGENDSDRTRAHLAYTSGWSDGFDHGRRSEKDRAARQKREAHFDDVDREAPPRAAGVASQDFRDGAATGAATMEARLRTLDGFGIPITRDLVQQVMQAIVAEYGGTVHTESLA